MFSGRAVGHICTERRLNSSETFAFLLTKLRASQWNLAGVKWWMPGLPT